MQMLLRETLTSFGPLRRMRYRIMRSQRGDRGETDESSILRYLSAQECAPQTFIEFGFHPVKFNCAELAHQGWRGLLIDADPDQVNDGRILLPGNVEIENRFITLDDMNFIKSRFEKIGILSIDVDGNDYWFLQELLDTKPSVISVEYNSSFGIEPITVPYDERFDRHQKHQSGWYHGASLTALSSLCAGHGYGLAAVSRGGANAFFTKRGTLDPAKEWRPNAFRETYSGTSHENQWEAVKDMPFVRV